MMLRAFVIALCAACACAEYVTLELSFSADGARVPSRSLLAQLSIGVPEQQYWLMLDLNSSAIELNSCLAKSSFTFDITGESSDMVLFEEDQLADPQPHGYFRFPVKQHCTDVGGMPPNFYRNCQKRECAGLLGLSRASPMWDIWTAYTLTLDSLHLGRGNHHHRAVEADNSIACANAPDERLCEFDALLGSERVVVDFHLDDSYIYVPQRIYALYIAGRNLYGINGASLGAAHPQHDLSNDTRRFRRQLENSRETARQHSRYFAGAEHTYGEEWPPLVLSEVAHGRGAARRPQQVLVLDYDLLVHSPSYSNSYGNGRRSSSERFFGERSTPMLTLLIKPHPTEPYGNRVSIGNSILRRYALHKDQAAGLLRIEERLFVEHFFLSEILVGLLLYTYFIFSLCYTLSQTASMGMCLQQQCESCGQPRSAYTRTRLHGSHYVRIAVASAVAALACWALMHTHPFLDEGGFHVWAWLLLVDNALMAAVALLSRSARQAEADGTFCWRSLRTTVAAASTTEQMALLGVLFISLIMRRDSLGTLMSASLMLVYFFNCLRHFIQSVAAWNGMYMLAHRATHLRRLDLPHLGHEIAWLVFVFLHLGIINVGVSCLIGAKFVVYPAMRSFSFTVLAYLGAVYMAVWIVESYETDVIRKRKFAQSLF